MKGKLERYKMVSKPVGEVCYCKSRKESKGVEEATGREIRFCPKCGWKSPIVVENRK
jgi:hypothetical protein